MKLPAAWLCCLLLTSPAWAADTVVSGKVYLERDGKPGRGATDPGLAGVQVSNGEAIVKTAADGSYSLPVRDGQTVFVIKPDAYSFPKAADGLPSFWRHYRPNGSPALKYGGIAATSDVTATGISPCSRIAMTAAVVSRCWCSPIRRPPA